MPQLLPPAVVWRAHARASLNQSATRCAPSPARGGPGPACQRDRLAARVFLAAVVFLAAGFVAFSARRTASSSAFWALAITLCRRASPRVSADSTFCCTAPVLLRAAALAFANSAAATA